MHCKESDKSVNPSSTIQFWFSYVNISQIDTSPEFWVSTCIPHLLCSCMKLWVDRHMDTSRLWSSHTLKPNSLHPSSTAAALLFPPVWTCSSVYLSRLASSPCSLVVQLPSYCSHYSHCPSSTVNSTVIIPPLTTQKYLSVLPDCLSAHLPSTTAILHSEVTDRKKIDFFLYTNVAFLWGETQPKFWYATAYRGKSSPICTH